MKVREFIDGYKRAQKKDAFIEKHIVTKYLPYEQKVATAEKIVNVADYKQVGEKRVYWKDSPIVYELYITRVIEAYTDIEMDNRLEAFNLFEQEGLSSILLDAIKDSKAFNAVLNMVRDDTEQNNSLVPFLDTKMDALNMVLAQLDKKG